MNGLHNIVAAEKRGKSTAAVPRNTQSPAKHLHSHKSQSKSPPKAVEKVPITQQSLQVYEHKDALI